MHLSDRIVTELPLNALWINKGELNAFRERYLNKEDIKELLKETPVLFVIANLGDRLKWLSITQCYDFWKCEVQNHIVNTPEKFYLEDYDNDYAFVASRWTINEGQTIILLEKYH